MLNDKKSTWIIEYVIGLGLLVVISPAILSPNTHWSMAYSWAYLLFVACSGIILVSAASSMRQRMKLEERIENLEGKIKELTAEYERVHQQTESEEKHTNSEQLVESAK